MFSLIVLQMLASSVLSAPGSEFVSWFETVKMKNETIRLSYKPYENTWDQYKKEYGKSYLETEVDELRYTIFVSNLKLIEEHNARYVMGEESYYVGINQFADMTEKEFSEMLGLAVQNDTEVNAECSSYLPAENVVVPDAIDWRQKGFVTPVKNQGHCGSCWAFSTTGSLEGQYFRKTKTLVSLSEQQLVDCSGKFGNDGCDGGMMSNAFAYIKYFGGLESGQDYHYVGKEQTCTASKSKVVATCLGCAYVKKGSESSLKSAVGEVGPVSVAIYAGPKFIRYQGAGEQDGVRTDILGWPETKATSAGLPTWEYIL
ncbi:hypothetical protein CHS0354_010225 [Potamilus streckersoni]|uniref:Uncharacterized protein n=1 Tax=Potamilus streckersoni TaxID=2493646 RepID=A0AAE0VJC3_9BIVA|nr:hypothetical protein CHS0354_010225 [Potamilus streckersoni]